MRLLPTAHRRTEAPSKGMQMIRQCAVLVRRPVCTTSRTRIRITYRLPHRRTLANPIASHLRKTRRRVASLCYTKVRPFHSVITEHLILRGKEKIMAAVERLVSADASAHIIALRS